jgi:hypothetical protein
MNSEPAGLRLKQNAPLGGAFDYSLRLTVVEWVSRKLLPKPDGLPGLRPTRTRGGERRSPSHRTALPKAIRATLGKPRSKAESAPLSGSR